MLNFQLVLDVVQKYGLSLYHHTDETTRNETETTVDFLRQQNSPGYLSKQFLFSNEHTVGDYTVEKKMKDYVSSYEFHKSFYRIVDLDKWLDSFQLSSEDFPFPLEYLSYLTFYGPTPSFQRATYIKGFASVIGDLDLLTFYAKKTHEEIRLELCPSYAVHKIFHPVEAREKADEDVIQKFFILDDFLNSDAAHQMKQDLFDAVVQMLMEYTDFSKHHNNI